MHRLLLLSSPYVLLILCILTGQQSQAQDTLSTNKDKPTVYVIKTLDGKVFEGPAVERTTEYIILNTAKIGYIRIFFVDIETMERAEVTDHRNSSGTKAIQPYQTSPQYLTTPSAFGLEKNQGYYQNTWLVINHVGFAFTDYFSMGAGFIPVFVSGDGDIPIWVMPKFSIPIVEDQIELSIGSFNQWSLGSSNFGFTYGKIALGGPQAHLAVGVGLSYEDSELNDGVLFTLDGLIKVGPRATLTTENYATGDIGVYSAGFHQPLGDLVIDLGLVVFSDEFDVFGGPYLGLTVPFTLK